MDFEYAHIEAYPNWALDGPKLYFMGKIYWNPEVNTDSLLTLFCSDMFAKSRNIMKDYFTTLENLNTSMNNDATRNRRLSAYTTQLPLNEKEMQMMHYAGNLLDQAVITASSNEEKERINFFAKGFRFSQYFFDLYNSKVNIDALADKLKSYLKENIAGDSMVLNIAKDLDFLPKTDAIIDNIVKQKKTVLSK